MTKVIKFSEDMFGWQRKPGPVRVWRMVDGRKKTDDGNIPRFSIQEIPQDRLDDVMDLMFTIFVKDEPMCHHSNVIDDPVAMEDFRKLWSFALQQGAVVGAFVVEDGNPKPTLAGANITLVNCDVTEKSFKTRIEFNAEIAKKILEVMEDLGKEKDTRKVYNVDKYITAFGLCVDPKYRGQGLGIQLLDARKEMSVAYDIRATSTVFTAPAAQKIASQAGFELLAERNFVDMRNDDGTEVFPGIPHKSIKLMGKSFS